MGMMTEAQGLDEDVMMRGDSGNGL
jgi:hypothetical protein